MNDLQSFTNCCRRIEIEYGRDGWHGEEEVTPALYSVHRDRGRLKPVRLGIAEAIWDKGPPGIVVGGIARIIPQYDRLMDIFRSAPEWIGAALAVEAWQVKVTDPAGEAELKVYTEHRQLHRHPERTTIRAVYGITREQHRVMVIREQGHDTEVHAESDLHFSGTIAEGLVELVATIDDLLENG